MEPGLATRRATVDDAKAIADLMLAVDLEHGLDPWVTESDVSEDLTDPELDIANNTWVVEDSGELVGYGELWNVMDEDVGMEVQGYVAPAHRGRGIGGYLIDATEEAARAVAARRTKHPVRLWNFIPSVDTSAHSLLEERRYSVVRHFFHMAIDLAEVGDPPDPPDGIILRSLDPERDARPLYELIEHAFREHWNWSSTSFETFWRRVAGRDDFDPELSLIAMRGGTYVGASWNITKIDRGWVQDLAVHEDARRQGLGELLLRHTFARFKERGWKRVGLGLDAGNVTGALRLYERVGMHVTRQFDTYEKRLSEAPSSE
jgi:mycothiol synthase